MSQFQPLTFREETPNRKFFFAGLIVVFCLVNFLVSWFVDVTLPYKPSGILVSGSAGVILSQVVLLGFLLVYLPFDLVARFVLVCFFGMLLWLSLLFGAYLFAFPGLSVLEDMARMLPIIVLAFATPFAAAKHFLGWKIRFDVVAKSANSQMGIINLLTATGLVAGSMAILSSGNSELIIVGLYGTAICLAVSFVFLLPLTKVVMGSNRPFITIVSISIVALVGVLILIWSIERFVGPINAWVRFGYSFGIASFAFWFGIELLLFRRFGGNLAVRWRNDRAR